MILCNFITSIKNRDKLNMKAKKNRTNYKLISFYKTQKYNQQL